MKTHSFDKLITTTFLMAVTLLIAGCASSGYRTSESTVSTLQSLATRIESTGTQMDIAVTELNSLVNNPQPDLRPQFDRFSSAVGKLGSLSTQMQKTDLRLADRGKLHFENWDKELALIQNEAIRSSGQARKLELQSRFDSVRNTCLSVGTSVTPVQSDLSDLRRILNSDLNTSGLAAIRDNANRVTQQATPVRQSIGNLVSELRSLGVAMSPQNTGVADPLK
jgi:hypothetical protein